MYTTSDKNNFDGKHVLPTKFTNILLFNQKISLYISMDQNVTNNFDKI